MSDDTKPPAEDPKATAPEAVVGSEDLHATDLDLTEANAAGDTAPVRIGERRGMFGPTRGSDTTGYGGLRTPILFPGAAEKPYGSYFDELTTALEQALGTTGDTAYGSAVERVVVDRGELTLHIRREALPAVARALRDDPALRFEICTGVSGVHFPGEAGRELHAVYHLLSITHNRRLRLEVSAPDDDARIPSVVETWPAADWRSPDDAGSGRRQAARVARARLPARPVAADPTQLPLLPLLLRVCRDRPEPARPVPGNLAGCSPVGQVSPLVARRGRPCPTAAGTAG